MGIGALQAPSQVCQSVCGRLEDEKNHHGVIEQQLIAQSDKLDGSAPFQDNKGLSAWMEPETDTSNGFTEQATMDEVDKKDAEPEICEKEYCVVIDKSTGETLGVNVNVSACSSGLPVLGIKAGLFQQWNVSNPDRAVAVGDIIVGVNGVRGEAHILAKLCATDPVLELVLERGAGDSDGDGGATANTAVAAEDASAPEKTAAAADKTSFRYLIVGGGVCAGYACREFVSHGAARGEIGIICCDPWPPYERPAITKAYLHPPTAKVRARLPGFHTCVGTGGERQDLTWYEQHGISLLAGPANRLDNETKQIETLDGKCYSYEKLLLATGCSPVIPDLPGARLQGVHYIREEKDAANLVKHLETIGSGGKVVIVGSGYISMELAAAISGWGIEVTILCRGKHVMNRLFDDGLAKWIQDVYRKKGVTILVNTPVKSFMKKGQSVSAVKLASGTRLPCDAAVVGVGAKPNIDWLKKGNFKMEKGGLKVDDQMQTSVQDIYAMGDIICYPSLYGDHRRHAHVDNARKSAAQAARGAAGVETSAYAYLPYCYSRVFEYTDEPLTYFFYGDKYGRPVLVPRNEKCVAAIWEKEKRIVGIMIMGMPGPTAEERERMQAIALEQPPLPSKSSAELAKIFDKLSSPT